MPIIAYSYDSYYQTILFEINLEFFDQRLNAHVSNCRTSFNINFLGEIPCIDNLMGSDELSD